MKTKDKSDLILPTGKAEKEIRKEDEYGRMLFIADQRAIKSFPQQNVGSSDNLNFLGFSAIH
ncbi:MAG: hypothetical protein WBN66_03090 [Smithella sp.]